jgi:hypothetical protein
VSDAAPGALPSLAEALAWRGFGLDDAGGIPVGLVIGAYADAETGAPAWLTVVPPPRRRLLRLLRRRTRTVIVPIRECAAMPGRVWAAQDREAVRAAPPVDASRPLLREHEATICLHYGIGETIGRHAEIAGRAAGSITALPSFQ